MNWSHYLFSFNGRINRAKWWLFILVCIAWVIVSWVIAFVFISMGPSMAGIWGIITLLVWLLLLYAYLAVGAKRLHDRNKSAIWLLLFVGVPTAINVYIFYSMFSSMMGMATSNPNMTPEQAMAAMQGGGGSMNTILSLIGLVIGIWALVELGILKGTTGDNQYGPDPLAGKM